MGGSAPALGAAAVACLAVLLAVLPRGAPLGSGGGRASPAPGAVGAPGPPEAGPPPAPAAGRPAASPAVPPDHEYPRLGPARHGQNIRVWSAAELARHDGREPDRPLLLCILGEVYDVGPGARHYGPSGGYQGFVGRDRSRAFADSAWLSSESDAASEVEGLRPEDLESISGWRGFYREHEEYRFVGVLEGRYFDAKGMPTDEMTRVEALLEHGRQDEEIRQELRARFMSCNSRHAQAEPHFELWCDDSYHHKGSLPVHVYLAIQGRQTESFCACLTPQARAEAEAEAAAEAGKPVPSRASVRLVGYAECAAGQQRCKRPKGSKPP